MSQQDISSLASRLANFTASHSANYNSPELVAVLSKTFISHNITIEDWNTIIHVLQNQGATVDEICQILPIIGGAVTGISELEEEVRTLLNTLSTSYVENSTTSAQTMYELYNQYKDKIAYVHLPNTGIEGWLKAELKTIHSTTCQLIISIEYDKVIYNNPVADTISLIQHIKATYISAQGAYGTVGTSDPITAFADTTLLEEEGSRIEFQTFATDVDLQQKQNKLVAGNGISINNDTNVISVTGISGFVDDRLDDMSANPVENRVVTNALNGKQNTIDYADYSDIEDLFS